MLGIISTKDSKVKNTDITFVHFNSINDEEIEIECRPFAHALSKKLNRKKVYLFYGEKGKIIYEFPL